LRKNQELAQNHRKITVSLSDSVYLKRLNFAVMIFTIIIVLAVGSIIYVNTTSRAPESFSIDGRSEELVAETRGLASVGESVYNNSTISALKLAKSEILETIDLSCLKSATVYNLKTIAKQVRLRARNCSGHSLLLDETSMVNRASGVSATIFALGKNRFTSDYLSLSEGENEIWVQAKLINGESTNMKVIISKQVSNQTP
jgi:hypothetical protein